MYPISVYCITNIKTAEKVAGMLGVKELHVPQHVMDKLLRDAERRAKTSKIPIHSTYNSLLPPDDEYKNGLITQDKDKYIMYKKIR